MFSMSKPFDPREHTYKNEAFAELVKDAVRFFNGTPVHPLELNTTFEGAGVYSLYYTGNLGIYKKYADLNRLAYNYPIYVGKAVPRGWRTARCKSGQNRRGNELYTRLKEHKRSIEKGNDLLITDFACRFVIFENESVNMISTIESTLITLNRPLWNSVIDGFGNHTPGAGRFQQAKSDWDVVHYGREWANKCSGVARDQECILNDIAIFLDKIG